MKSLILSKKLQEKVREKIRTTGETGMGWTCVRVILKNGRVFKNAIVLGDSEISKVYGYDLIPFEVSDIKDVIVTHREDYPNGFKGFTQ